MAAARRASVPPTSVNRIAGRAFLFSGETEVAGYGLYSYLLFGSAPSASDRPRYLAAVEAYLRQISNVSDLEQAGAVVSLLNVTHLPLKLRPPTMNPDAADVLDRLYDYPRAQVLLSKLPGPPHTRGPYLISTLKPLTAIPALSGEYLYQDLSDVPPSMTGAWLNQFIVQTSQQRFWSAPAMPKFVLELRTDIEIAANGITDTQLASTEVKSLLASIIWSPGTPAAR